MALVAALLPLIVPSAAVQRLQQPGRLDVDGFSNAGVFVLLALGLNIVVGLAGLLDLGYAAFFAIGAYTYAFGASPSLGHRTSRSWPMLARSARWSRPCSASCSARRRCACAATTWRS